MQNAVLISTLAGLVSAFLYGALAPGALMFAPLLFVAPAPLIAVGLGGHPLMAALGALIACVLVSIGLSSQVAISFALIIGLPSYLITHGIFTLLRRLPPQVETRKLGQIIGIYVLGGIGVYAVIAVMAGALIAEPDFAAFQVRVANAFQRMIASFGGPAGAPADPMATAQMAQMFARIFLPISAAIIAISLIFSLWIAVKLLTRAGRLPFAPFPAYEVRQPRDVLFWFAGAFLISQLSGFAGMAGASFMAVLMVLLMLNGLALLHARSRGANSRTVLLWGAWIGLALFAPSALIFSFAGALDAAFDFRSPPAGPETRL